MKNNDNKKQLLSEVKSIIIALNINTNNVIKYQDRLSWINEEIEFLEWHQKEIKFLLETVDENIAKLKKHKEKIMKEKEYDNRKIDK